MIEIQTNLHFKKYNAMDSDYFLFLIDLILKMNKIKSRNFEIFSNKKLECHLNNAYKDVNVHCVTYP